MKYKGGGIIFTSINPNNELVLLLGRENKYCNEGKYKWCEFGGGNDGESIIENASREATEEIMGYLGTKEYIKKKLLNNKKYYIGDKFRIYFLPIEYDEKLPYYFNNNRKILEKYLSKDILKKNKIFEKDNINWFLIEDLKINYDKLRKWFKITSKEIIAKQNDIKSFTKKYLKICNKSLNNTFTKKNNKIRKNNKTRKNNKIIRFL